MSVLLNRHRQVHRPKSWSVAKAATKFNRKQLLSPQNVSDQIPCATHGSLTSCYQNPKTLKKKNSAFKFILNSIMGLPFFSHRHSLGFAVKMKIRCF